MEFGLIVVAVIVLAYANGANDNYKGVATLFGTGTTSYRGALAWGTAATLLGSLTAVLFAGQLLKNFTGKGLVPADLAAEPGYVAAVALGAGLAVLAATRFGMPISTTHGLIGALLGAGLAARTTVDGGKLASTFLIPLLLSPILAIVVTALVYHLFRAASRRLNISRATCICVGNEVVAVVPVSEATMALERVRELPIAMDHPVTCREQYGGRVLGIEVAALVDSLHFLSAGLVSFGRGLNDTPKIAALLLVLPSLGGWSTTAIVGAVIAVGGVFSARRVAETMSRKITRMTHEQGLTANLVTGLIVLGASPLGLPVSTTHVSCGSLFGLGAATHGANRKMIATIVASWVFTIPVAALIAAAAYRLISSR